MMTWVGQRPGRSRGPALNAWWQKFVWARWAQWPRGRYRDSPATAGEWQQSSALASNRWSKSSTQFGQLLSQSFGQVSIKAAFLNISVKSRSAPEAYPAAKRSKTKID